MQKLTEGFRRFVSEDSGREEDEHDWKNARADREDADELDDEGDKRGADKMRSDADYEEDHIEEQLPPSPTDVADAYADSLTGGSVPTGDEEGGHIEVDRLEEPETEAIVHVLDLLQNPAKLADFHGGDLIEKIFAFRKRRARNPKAYDDPELKAVFLDRLASEVAKLPSADAVPSGAKWATLTGLLHRLKMRMKPTSRGIAQLKGADKEEARRLRAQETAVIASIDSLFSILQSEAEHPGSAEKGQFGVGKKMKFQNVEDWPELEEPPSEDEIEDMRGAVGHARVEENKKRKKRKGKKTSLLEIKRRRSRARRKQNK